MSQNLERFGVEAVWLDAKFEKGVKEYNTSMKRADQETQKFTKDSSKAFQQFDRQASTSLTDVRSGIQLTMGALRTFGRIASATFQTAQEGAQQLSQQRSFAIVSGGAEQAAKNLQAMREATRGTATDAQLMESALGILATGLASNEEELFAVTRNVTTLAGVLKGFGSERALLSFQLLSTDLVASKARLDDFGLTFEQVKPKVDALVASGVELQEATRTVLLEEMSKVMESLGLNAATAADSFGQATAAAGNLENEFKQALAPGISLVADAFTDALTDTNNFEDAFDSLAESAIKLGANLAGARAALAALREQEGPQTFIGLARTIVETGDELNVTTAFQEAYNEALETGKQRMESAGEAAGELADETFEVDEALVKFNETIANARTQALETFLKRGIATERKLQDAAIQRARKIEDIERQSANRRAQIEEQFAQTIANLNDQAAEERRTRQINLARQLEQIERQFQERKRAIQATFATSFSRAVRSRDALALVEAIRTRKTELDEAKRQRDQQRAEATTNAVQEEQEQQRSLQRQVEAARQARAQQILDAQAAQQQQIDDLNRSEQRKLEDQQRANNRFLQDQSRAFQDQQVRAMAAYRQNEAIYTQHLQRMLQLTNTFIPSIFASGVGGQRPRGAGGGGPQMLADGGAFIATGPTSFVAGEAGPELVMAQPLSQIANTNPVSPQIGGQMRHAVSGEIQASMAGFQGRLTVAINSAVRQAMTEVFR